MRSDTFQFKASDGRQLFVHAWEPDEGVRRRAVVHVAHGMAEHAARYARLAEALTAAGYVVYANDHRGHGKTLQKPEERGFFASSRGFARVVEDLVELIASEKGKNPGLPVAIMGHSMGAQIVQGFLVEHGSEVQAAVLSGGSGKPSPLASAGRIVARIERRRLGPRGTSEIIDKLTFQAFNKPFGGPDAPFSWLSRDAAEVAKYRQDPDCGFLVTVQLWIDLLDSMAVIARPSSDARIPKDLPIYVFAGAEDPVSERAKGLRKLVEAYEKAGIRDVTSRYYEGGRHEMLNETNRDEVTRDLVAWLDARVGAR